LLGVIEGFSGVLLCGISTAFIFAVLNAVFQFRLRQRLIKTEEACTKINATKAL
jgi:hypothetical protein